MKWEINWSSLFYSLELLSVLVIASGVLHVGLRMLLIVVEDACGKYDNCVTRWTNSKHVTPRVRRRAQRWAPMVAMLVVGYIVGAAGIFSPVRERHDVEVLKAESRVIEVVDAGKRQTWKICEDGDNLPLKAGMVMPVMQYEQGEDCIRFTPRTTVTYLRNSSNDVVDRQGNKLFGGN